MKYGYGTGTSKKQAKLAAAKASLEILIPEMREKIRSDNKNGKRSGITNFPDEEETSLSVILIVVYSLYHSCENYILIGLLLFCIIFKKIP